MGPLPTPQAPSSPKAPGSTLPGSAETSPGSSAVAPGASEAQTQDEGAFIPDVDLTPIPADESATAVVTAEMPVIKQLDGAWEQIDASTANAPDFAPGGYVKSVIVIDAASSELHVYRGFGIVGRPSAMFVSGQFHCEFRPDGRAAISGSAVRPTNFFRDERTIPIDADTTITIVPPVSGFSSTQWSSEPGEGILVMGGKRYRRASAEIKDLVIHGEAGKVDKALDAAIAAAEASAATASGPAGNGSGPMQASGSSNVDFFGMRVRGRYIAFVIDCSGSMAEAGKMQAALDELRRTVLALPADANVFVMFFNSGALQVGSFGSWVQAQSPACMQLVQAFGTVGPGGGTNPIPALQIAFSQQPRPDEIFLMTDGMMTGDVRGEIARLNGNSRARTRVHSIAFGQDADRAALEAIATDNSGNFRAVP